MLCINWTKAHSSFIHACADLWTCIARCSSCVAGCAYYLYYCILGIFLKLDLFQDLAQRILRYFELGQVVGVAVMGVKSASSFFVLVTSDPGLEEQK